MQWLIQCTGIPDTNTLPILNVVKERNLVYHSIGIIPFEHTLTGLDEADPSVPTLFYGSTQLLELAPKQYRPGCFYEKEWFDPKYWIDKRDDFLNPYLRLITVSELRSSWVDKPTFIKSIEPKQITGQILEPEKEDYDRWLVEHSDLDGSTELIFSDYRKIDKEWRFFILNNQVITGSSYKRDGCLIIRDPMNEQIYSVAEQKAKQWLPHRNVVMDICLLRSGEYKVVEFNCFNSSGFYNCDVGRIVDSVSLLYD